MTKDEVVLEQRLKCLGETDEAYLFYGPEGLGVQHLSIAKEALPGPVVWVRVRVEVESQDAGGYASGT